MARWWDTWEYHSIKTATLFITAMRIREAAKNHEEHAEANRLLQRIDERYPRASFELGRAAEFGWGRPRSLADAALYYGQAAADGYEEAQKRADELWPEYEKWYLANTVEGDDSPLLRKPERSPPPELPFAGLVLPAYASVGDAVRNEAQRGHPVAQWLLGECLTHGRLDNYHVRYDVDPAQGREWFVQAAMYGHPNAQRRVQEMFAYEVGTEEERAKARARLEEAQRGGNTIARDFLSPPEVVATLSAENPRPVAPIPLPADVAPSEAQEAYKRLSASSDAQATEAALADLRRLAKEGDAEASYLLGNALAGDPPGKIPVNLPEAVLSWTKAARAGHPGAQFALGLAFRDGTVVRVDLDQAAGWFEKAAEGGHADAKVALEAVNRERKPSAPMPEPNPVPATNPPVTPPEPEPEPKMAGPSEEELRKRVAEASALDEAVRKDPSDSRLYEARCVARLFAKQDELALQDAEKLIELKPESDDGYGLRYAALKLLGREADAEAALQPLRERWPSRIDRLDKEIAEFKKLRGE